MLTIVPSFNHLVPALLHSLWQTTVLALLLALLLRAASPRGRPTSVIWQRAPRC
jgi:hypothetical protein